MPYSRYIVGSIPWYSALIVLGIALCLWLGKREEKRKGLPRDVMIDVALVAVPCGIVGARIYYVLFSLEQFRDDWLSVLYIWNGGIAIYGAVIGGGLGVWVYARRKKLSFAALLDMVAPGLLLAQAIGRWGNYFNMEAYGPAITDAQWQFFPAAVFIPTDGGWHAATFFYESLWNALGFVALWSLRKHAKRDGDTFLWYLVIYGSGRFLIEGLRTDSLYWGSMRVSQYLSLALLLASCVLWLVRLGRQRKLWPLCYGLIACAACLTRFLLPIGATYGWFMLGALTVLTILGVPGLYRRMGERGQFTWISLLFIELMLAVMALTFAQSGMISAFVSILRSVLTPLQLGFVFALLPGSLPSTPTTKEVSPCPSEN